MYEKEFKTILAMAKDKVDDIEVLLSANRSFSVRINNQEIENFSYADTRGIGIRVIKNGKAGIAYTEKFSDDAFQHIIKEALDNCKFIEKPDKAIIANYPTNECGDLKTYNTELAGVDVNEKIQLAKDLEKLAQEADKRIINCPYCGYGDGESFVKIANSKGLDKEFKTNYASAYIYVLAGEGDEKKMAGDFVLTRDFKELNAQDLAQKAVEKACGLLGGKTFDPGTYPVVFNNEMTANLISTFSSLFSAKSVQEGRSLLKGKIGEKIASDKITLVDDGLYVGGFATSPFDSEGHPSATTMLIENGVLKNYLHNTETAKKDNTVSTGNGARSYKSALGISPSNFFIKKGDVDRADLFKKHPAIIEITSLQGLHSGANPISGDFSLGAEGFIWVDGEKKHALKNFTVSGNFLTMLAGVEEIANDFKFVAGSIGASSILIKELALSS